METRTPRGLVIGAWAAAIVVLGLFVVLAQSVSWEAAFVGAVPFWFFIAYTVVAVRSRQRGDDSFFALQPRAEQFAVIHRCVPIATGGSANLAAFALEVELEGHVRGPARRTYRIIHLPRGAQPSFQPGARLPVRFRPSNPAVLQFPLRGGTPADFIEARITSIPIVARYGTAGPSVP